MNITCSWSQRRFAPSSLHAETPLLRPVRALYRAMQHGLKGVWHHLGSSGRREVALALMVAPGSLNATSHTYQGHHHAPSPAGITAGIAPRTTLTAPQPSYYWAIPERSLISTMLSHTRPHPFHYLDRDGGSLEDISKQSLAYPQSVQAIMLDSTESAIACARSWLQPLHALGSCGQPAGYFRNVLFWDPSRIASPPHWSALWDVARYPGQRAFFQGPRITLEIALLADGVPPARLYDALSTSAGVERAFHKLDQLSPYIIWWRSPSQAYHLLREQTVLMGVAPGGIILSSQARRTLSRPYLAQNEDILYSPAVWGIPATLSAEKTNETKVILLTNPPHLPDMPSPLPAESLEISDSFWATHALQLSERFNKWLAHSTPSPP